MIYLDNAATTKPSPSVINTITDVLANSWGNPSSLYDFGINSYWIIEEVRDKVAKLINCDKSEVYFTSSSCESNSLAILGYLKAHPMSALLTTNIEHKSIIEITKCTPRRVYKLMVDKDGKVNLGDLISSCEIMINDGYDIFASIQWANNEIGVIQNMPQISEIIHRYGGVLHSDATQIIPDRKINSTYVDMLSFSGHKIHAPKGIGVLHIKNKNVTIKPLIYGSQENKLRGGTENVAYIAGLGTAIDELYYPKNMKQLRDYFSIELQKISKNITVIGDFKNRLHSNLSVCFGGVSASKLMNCLSQSGVYCSTGSACNQSAKSYVLEAIGLSEDEINSTIRFSLSCTTTKEEIDEAIVIINKTYNYLKGGK